MLAVFGNYRAAAGQPGVMPGKKMKIIVDFGCVLWLYLIYR